MRARREVLVPTEYQECKAFWQYCVALGYAPDLIKQANERKESQGWFIRALIAIGFRKGLPDYQYIVSNGKYHSLWIEMKRKNAKGLKSNHDQNEWIERLLKRGHYACYAMGCDDAIRILHLYLNNQL